MKFGRSGCATCSPVPSASTEELARAAQGWHSWKGTCADWNSVVESEEAEGLIAALAIGPNSGVGESRGQQSVPGNQHCKVDIPGAVYIAVYTDPRTSPHSASPAK